MRLYKQIHPFKSTLSWRCTVIYYNLLHRLPFVVSKQRASRVKLAICCQPVNNSLNGSLATQSSIPREHADFQYVSYTIIQQTCQVGTCFIAKRQHWTIEWVQFRICLTQNRPHFLVWNKTMTRLRDYFNFTMSDSISLTYFPNCHFVAVVLACRNQ